MLASEEGYEGAILVATPMSEAASKNANATYIRCIF